MGNFSSWFKLRLLKTKWQDPQGPLFISEQQKNIDKRKLTAFYELQQLSHEISALGEVLAHLNFVEATTCIFKNCIILSNVKIRGLGLFMSFFPPNNMLYQRKQMHNERLRIHKHAMVLIHIWTNSLMTLSWSHFISNHTVYTQRQAPHFPGSAPTPYMLRYEYSGKGQGGYMVFLCRLRQNHLTHPVRWHWLRCS